WSGRLWGGCRLGHVQRGARPLHHNLGAAFRKVPETEPRAGALEQTLGDENAETHVLCLATAASGNVGLADTGKHVRAETRPVVHHLDADLVLGPVDRHDHLALSESYSVLDEVTEPMHDLRAARDLRLLAARPGTAGTGCVNDTHVLRPIWLARRLYQRGDWKARIGGTTVAHALLREVCEDHAAALALTEQKRGVLGMGVPRRQVAS